MVIGNEIVISYHIKFLDEGSAPVSPDRQSWLNEYVLRYFLRNLGQFWIFQSLDFVKCFSQKQNQNIFFLEIWKQNIFFLNIWKQNIFFENKVAVPLCIK